METIVFEYGKKRALFGGILSLVFSCILGYFSFFGFNLAFKAKDFEVTHLALNTLPLLAAIFFGFYSYRGFKLGLISNLRLTLDSQGFTDELLGFGCVFWKDIVDLTFVENKIRGQRIYSVRVLLNDESNSLQKISVVSKLLKKIMFRDFDLEVQVSSLSASPETVFSYFNEFHKTFGK